MHPVASVARLHDSALADLRAELARVHLALERALESCNAAAAPAVRAALEGELARLHALLSERQRPRRR